MADLIHIAYYDQRHHALKYARTSGELTLAPDVYDFGVQQVGTTTSAAFTVSNTGTADLEVTATTISAAGGFSVDVTGGGTPCGVLPVTLSSGAGCTMAAEFSPAARGLHYADLGVTSSAGEATLSLSGIGVQGAQSLSHTPVAIEFPSAFYRSRYRRPPFGHRPRCRP